MRTLAYILLLIIIGCDGGGSSGDSEPEPQVIVAYGTSLTATGGWVEQLSCRPVNEGMPGQNSSTGLAELDNVLQHNPDTVSIEFAINDSALRWGVSSQESYANMKEIIETLQSHGARVILIITGPVCDQVDWPGNRLESYYSLHEQLASEMGIEVIDLYDLLSDGICDTPDHIHPSVSMWSEALPKLERICE